MKEKKQKQRREITGQVIYMGPHIRHLGLGYSAIFRNGIHKHLYESIDECPALGELFVPIDQCAAVRRELNFDYAHNMRGEVGKYVTFFREVQKWLAYSREPQSTPSGVTTEPLHHA
jgi:hypothetical protein